ncbi:MAG: hypothetical protein JST64_10030 [Actinobacteria bacterium]|nr:hypothetical protein [Actinomycetota bacterium]
MPHTNAIAPVKADPSAPTSFTVTPWWDPGLATRGVDPRDPYVERFWLSVLGPSTVLLLRRFARGFDEQPTGFRVGTADTALALGLGRGIGRSSPIMRTVDRAATFGMLRRRGEDHLEVRTHMPLLAARHVDQLAPVLRRLHADWVCSRERSPDPGRMADTTRPRRAAAATSGA